MTLLRMILDHVVTNLNESEVDTDVTDELEEKNRNTIILTRGPMVL